MNWFDRVRNSDAGRAAPERADALVEKAGGASNPDALESPSPQSEKAPPAAEVEDE